VLLGAVAAFLLAAELGFRYGRKRATFAGWELVEAEALGLLALLLGFTFAMAATRFDTRKTIILGEANALLTTYMRAKFLPEPTQGELQALLRRFAEARIEYYRADPDEERQRRAHEKVEGLKADLWAGTVAMAQRTPPTVLTSLFVRSLNRLYDIDASGILSLDNHVPDPVLGLVFAVGVLCSAAIGNGFGLAKRRSPMGLVLMPLLIAMSFTLIVDLDRSRRGLARVGRETLTVVLPKLLSGSHPPPSSPADR
jgi:hypothetical protein